VASFTKVTKTPCHGQIDSDASRRSHRNTFSSSKGVADCGQRGGNLLACHIVDTDGSVIIFVKEISEIQLIIIIKEKDTVPWHPILRHGYSLRAPSVKKKHLVCHGPAPAWKQTGQEEAEAPVG
jgi:hypothetical protein